MCIALYHKVNNFFSTSVLPNVANEEVNIINSSLGQMALNPLRRRWWRTPPHFKGGAEYTYGRKKPAFGGLEPATFLIPSQHFRPLVHPNTCLYCNWIMKKFDIHKKIMGRIKYMKIVKVKKNSKLKLWTLIFSEIMVNMSDF